MFELEQGSRFAEGTTVSEIRIKRLGLYPKVQVFYAETAPIIQGAFTVVGSEDRDLDGVVDTLLFDSLPDNVKPGTIVERYDRSDVGVVTQVDGTALVLSGPIAEVPTQVWFVLANVIGSPASQTVEGSRTHSLTLDMQNAEHLPVIQTLMGMVLISMGPDLVAELLGQGDRPLSAVTAREIQSAVQAMSGRGLHLDHYLTLQAEIPEKDRRAGRLAVEKVY